MASTDFSTPPFVGPTRLVSAPVVERRTWVALRHSSSTKVPSSWLLSSMLDYSGLQLTATVAVPLW